MKYIQHFVKNPFFLQRYHIPNLIKSISAFHLLTENKKIMQRRYLLLFIIGLLALVSCRKEDIIEDDPIVVIDPPVLIEYPVAKGVVKNNEEHVSGATVSVYQNEVFKGDVTTDIEGKFNTKDIPLEDGDVVTFEISKANFANAYRRRSIPSLQEEELYIDIISLDKLAIIPSPVDNPGSSNLISLSGYIKDLNDEPGTAMIAIEYELPNSQGGTTFYGDLFFPDLLGYYERLYPKDTELRISVRDTICSNYLTAYDIKIFLHLQAEIFGPFSSDHVIDDFINPINSIPHLGITGNLLDCDQVPVTFGEVKISIKDFENHNYIYNLSVDDQGAFTLSENSCWKFPYDLSIIGHDILNSRFTDTIFYTITTSQTMLTETLTACNDGLGTFSTVMLEIDNTQYIYDQTTVRYENGDLISDEQSWAFAQFTIPNAQEGTNTITNFVMVSWIDGNNYSAVPGSVAVELTTMTNNIAIGTFAGQFLDGMGIEYSGTGTLALVF